LFEFQKYLIPNEIQTHKKEITRTSKPVPNSSLGRLQL
jgi:hypothetical protein